VLIEIGIAIEIDIGAIGETFDNDRPDRAARCPGG
jgi:hypothetical protein